jgi:hypothetical protein
MRPKWIAMVLLCSTLCLSQELYRKPPERFSASNVKNDPSWHVVDASRPVRHRHLAFITEHPTRTTLLGIGAGAVIALGLQWGSWSQHLCKYNGSYTGTPPCPH